MANNSPKKKRDAPNDAKSVKPITDVRNLINFYKTTSTHMLLIKYSV